MGEPIPDGWKSWTDDPPTESKTIQVLFMNSKIFPRGAIVQAAVEEVQVGVIGDTNPTAWRYL